MRIAAAPLSLPDVFMLSIAELLSVCRGVAQLPENRVEKRRESLPAVNQRPLLDAFELE